MRRQTLGLSFLLPTVAKSGHRAWVALLQNRHRFIMDNPIDQRTDGGRTHPDNVLTTGVLGQLQYRRQRASVCKSFHFD